MSNKIFELWHCGDKKLLGIQSGEIKLKVTKAEGFFSHPDDHDKHCADLIAKLNGGAEA